MGRPKCFDRTDVLNAAIQLFWKKGFADTSLSDLEKATGVNKSGLYSEFKDKDDIFFECVKHYRDTSPLCQILQKEPLGWNNIEGLLKQSLTCTGQKGCFFTNTTREFSIIPDKVKTLLQENQKNARELVIANLKATKTKRDIEQLATMILTYASGVSLKLNAVKPDQVKNEIDAFLDLLKS